MNPHEDHMIVVDREWTPYETAQASQNGMCGTCIRGPLRRTTTVKGRGESFTVVAGFRCLWCGTESA